MRHVFSRVLLENSLCLGQSLAHLDLLSESHPTFNGKSQSPSDLLTPVRKAIRILGYHNVHCPSSAEKRQLRICFVWRHDELHPGLSQCLHQPNRASQLRPNVETDSVGHTGTNHAKSDYVSSTFSDVDAMLEESQRIHILTNSHVVSIPRPARFVGDIGFT